VFVAGLRRSDPPIINQGKLNVFIQEVFSNMDKILSYHKRLLAALFELQREQHPIILSIGTVVLDSTCLGAVFKFAPNPVFSRP
jgi:hypothetical protein